MIWVKAIFYVGLFKLLKWEKPGKEVIKFISTALNFFLYLFFLKKKILIKRAYPIFLLFTSQIEIFISSKDLILALWKNEIITPKWMNE